MKEITPHEKALILIKEFDYNARQVAEVLGIQTRTVSDKMKNEKYNKFSDSNFTKLLFHFQQKIENQIKVLEPFEKIKDLHQ